MRKAPLLRPTKTRSPALKSARNLHDPKASFNVHTVCENGLNLRLVPLPELDDRACCEGREHGAGQLEADGTTGNRIASENFRQKSTKVVKRDRNTAQSRWLFSGSHFKNVGVVG